MNNGNFAALRHLRDLGVDAHLFLYSDEPRHFLPQNDTWHWDRWAPFVHRLAVSNGGLDAVLTGGGALRRQLQGYDVYVGSGFAPVLFGKLGWRLDLFLPYAEGVEFIVHHSIRWRRPLSTAFSWVRKRLMERALKRQVKAIGAANLHALSVATFQRLQLQPVVLPALALYPEAAPDAATWPASVNALVDRMKRSPMVVFSHVSHIWKNLPFAHFFGGLGKRNQWLIEGFERYVKRSGQREALLCLFEYGTDVAASKELVTRLGIEAQVLWFPTMSRRELTGLMRHVDIGGSEFAGMLWGGCGWEFLSAGVPMLHQLDNPQDYDRPDEPLAPFFNVQSPDDIAAVLLAHDRASLRAAGARARAWFDAHHGVALARRYVNLLEQLRRQ
ncbi:MAG: hypothetical protein JNN03_01235 [Rubrivivax sp.]|nr:hypothetical protein [Rubrivivax sp.]